MKIFKLPFVFFSLGFLALLFSESVAAQIKAEAQVNSYWAPWIGVWTITEDRSANRADDLTKATVEIWPTTDGKGLEISRKMPQQPDIKEVLILDGTRRPVEATDCSGWQTARWDAGLIIGSSEMTCKESGAFATSSLRMILSSDQMVDILAIKAAGQTRLAVRRLAFEHDLISPGKTRLSLATAAARMAVSGPWNLSRVIQLSKTIDAPILEAALLEKNVQLNLTSKSLKQLAAANTPKGIIDLLVALAFPDEFDIQRNGQVSLRPWSSSFTSGGSAAISYAPGSSYYPGAFYNCYSPYNSYFGYGYGYGYGGLLSPGSCWGYYSPLWWDYPVYFNGPGGTGNIGSGATGNNGQLSASSGYVQIEPHDTGRHARPRQDYNSTFRSAGSYATGSTAGGTSSVGYSSGSTTSAVSSSGASSSSSSGSSSSGGSASPSGYSSGSSGGSQAVPR